MCMVFERRLQILLDEDRYKRVAAHARERRMSVGAVIREAIDRGIPAADAKRRAEALRGILAAPQMELPDPEELKLELEEIRAQRK